MSEEKVKLSVVEFSNYTQATYIHNNSKEWVSWGIINNYPDYLIELYNRNATHGAIVKGKAQYLYGKGLKVKLDGTVLEQARVQNWLENANRYEEWNEVYNKTCRSFELFNGFAWQIIWNLGGTSFEIYHMDLSKLRRSACGKKVFYCEAWLIYNGEEICENPNPENHSSFKEFPIFNPNIRTGTSVFYFRLETPASMMYGDLYPTPDYSGCLAEVETEIEITNFHLNHMKNGMFAASMLTLFNGEVTPEEERKFKKMFSYSHIGSKKAGGILLNFAPEGATPPDLKTLSSSDLDKMFELVTKRNQQNIFTAHKVHPVLFGVMTEGSLSDTSGEAVVKKWDQFQRAYVEGRQEIITEQIEYLAYILGMDAEIEVEQMTPVGRELPNDPTILGLFDQATLKKYYGDLYGIKTVDSTDQTQLEALPVNDNIKALTGIQYKRVQGYIAKYKQGKISYEEAAHFIKGYGLGDDYIKLVLGQKFSKADRTEELVALFEKFAIDDNDDEILSEEFVASDLDSQKIEFKAHKFSVEGSVLDMITGNPQITPEQISKQMNLSLEEVTLIIGGLITAGLIANQSGVLQVTDKGIKKDPAPVETEVYTVYKYATRDDVPNAKQSRPFCERLMALSRAGKRWTRDAIENITNQFGEDAWTYRGGFYNNPKDGEITPYCRHRWVGVIKTRRKNA